VNFPELVKALKAIRHRKGVSVYVVGDLSGRSGTVVRELEAGIVTRPRIDTVEAWARGLGYKLTYRLEKLDD
jgi:transcriptional regulator with XRE-family HTH domain